MAKGDPIPGDNQIARYCKNSQVENGRASGAAFMLEDRHQELSTVWMEGLQPDGDRNDQLRAVVLALNAGGLTTKPNGWLAVLTAADVTSLVELAGTALRLSVLHDPVEGNQAHAGVYGLPQPATPLAAMVGLAISQLVKEPAVQLRSL